MRFVQFYLFFFAYYIPLSSLFAQSRSPEFPPISNDAQISLITGEPGKELYTAWGHSAIRVYDPINGIDLVYNYGTFDFDAPGFYQKFLRGKLNYSLSVYDFKRMVLTYKYYNQSLFEQIINLTYDEKKAIYNFINNNYLPENRYYLYDFFFDNCSSRIKDVFQDILGSKLIFEDYHIKTHKTFRQLLDEFLGDSPWSDFGIDLILGIPADAVAASEEYMFLPYKLFDAFENAKIIKGNEYIPFVSNTIIIHQSIDIQGGQSFRLTPKILFWSLLIVVFGMSLSIKKDKKIFKVLDTTLFLSIGVTGFIIAFLWFFTDHIVTKDNLNLLWTFPSHFIIPFIIFKNMKSQWVVYYFLFWLIFLILFLGSWTILPQQMNYANIPIILMLIVRFYFNYKKTKSDVERRK